MGIINFYSNKKIIDGIRSNNPKILAYIYRNYYPMIETIILNRYKGSVADAKDIFQDSLIVIYERVMLNPPLILKKSFIAFLTTICKRQMIDKLRDKENIVNFEKEDDFPPESELEIIELINKAKRIKLYQKHFSEIGEKCQKLLNLALDGYSIREITTILNFSSENYTKKRKTLCKESLFKKIYYDSQFKELLYGKLWNIRKIPRW